MKVFLSVFISVNDMLGREALVVLADFSQIVAEEIDKPISNIRGVING